MRERRSSTVCGTSPGGRAAVLALVVFLAQGCTTVSPSSFSAAAPDVEVEAVEATRSVSIAAQPHPEPIARFNANGAAYEYNRDEFSREIAELLAESLLAAGVPVDGTSPTIGIRVDYMDFMFQGPCLLDYRVTLDGEVVFGLQSEGHSGVYTTACRRAIEDAVADIVRNPRTVEFLRGP